MYIGVNLYIVIFTLWPPYVDADGIKRHVQGWYYIAAIGGVMVVGFAYYLAVVPGSRNRFSIVRVTGADIQVIGGDNGEYDKAFGFKRRVSINFPVSKY